MQVSWCCRRHKLRAFLKNSLRRFQDIFPSRLGSTLSANTKAFHDCWWPLWISPFDRSIQARSSRAMTSIPGVLVGASIIYAALCAIVLAGGFDVLRTLLRRWTLDPSTASSGDTLVRSMLTCTRILDTVAHSVEASSVDDHSCL